MKYALIIIFTLSMTGCQHFTWQGDPLTSAYKALDTWARAEGYEPKFQEERTWTTPQGKARIRRKAK